MIFVCEEWIEDTTFYNCRLIFCSIMVNIRYWMGEFWHYLAGPKMHQRYACLLFLYIAGVAVILFSLPSISNRRERYRYYKKSSLTFTSKVKLPTDDDNDACYTSDQHYGTDYDVTEDTTVHSDGTDYSTHVSSCFSRTFEDKIFRTDDINDKIDDEINDFTSGKGSNVVYEADCNSYTITGTIYGMAQYILY